MKTEAPTFDSVWALLQDLAKQQAETDRQIKETGQLIKETSQQMKETDRKMGAWSTNIGAFAEEYFFNSFENGRQNFFGEKFDEIEKNLKGFKKGFKDEYDIVLINGHSLGIIEVKFKAHEKDIPGILKKAVTFRENFPDYANHRIYLGLASLAFYPELEDACIKEGIAIIKQVGDSVVINDAHLKVF